MRRPNKHLSPAWAIFTDPIHRPFFDALSSRIKERFSQIEIIVADRESQFFSGPTRSLAENALFHCEVSFIDLACPYHKNMLFDAVHRCLSYIIVGTESQIHKITENAEGDRFYESIEKRAIFSISDDSINRNVEPILMDNLIDLAIEISKRQFFLSYAGEDREFADRIARTLSERTLRVWYAPWEIAVGDSIVDRINEGIKDSAYVGVVLSPSSVDKPWCKAELNAALQMKLHIPVEAEHRFRSIPNSDSD